MKDLLIVVDKEDKILAYKTKKECHQDEGILHRAFSVFVFNKKGELLLQKRSKHKKLWPLFWSNTCCSHPKAEEKIQKAAEQRLKEELGFSCPLKFIDKLYYKACYKEAGCEKEITYIFVGRYEGRVFPNKNEMAGYRWVDVDWLGKNLESNSEIYTPWLKKIIRDTSFAL